MADFKGIKRRQELRGEAAGMAVIDDFAHHPTAVRETISAIRARYPDRRLVAIFEPRSNTSRRRVFESEYADALAAADEAILAGVFKKADSLAESELLRPDFVVERIRKAGKQAHYLAGVDDIIEHLVRGKSGKDVVLIMSNGGFGNIWERLRRRRRSTASSRRRSAPRARAGRGRSARSCGSPTPRRARSAVPRATYRCA
jgi:UDP-N-acetylmuramate: L-alanyl-gamma-D-glutamyl-meso-diaminopimelate ligase